ncbi:hypothetical protein BH10CHL1_BH10CHL1_38620 [soil metagenome]
MNNRQTFPEIEKKNGHRALLLLSLLFAFGLRLFHLGGESLWYDETVSVALARQSIPALIAHTARDIHPPGYYLLLHGWQWLVHPTLAHGLEFLYAWPSLCFGLLMVALLYPVARRLTHPAVGLLAVWLAAVNPFQLWYSQEVRMYTLGGALGLLCFWALLQYLAGAAAVEVDDEQQVYAPQQTSLLNYRWLLTFALSSAAGLYTLYYFLFLLIALNLIALIGLGQLIQRQSRQSMQAILGWLGAQLIIILLYAPWLPILWRQATDPPVPGWRAPWSTGQDLAKALSESLAALLIGQSPPGAILWPWALTTLVIMGLYSYTKILARQRSHLGSHYVQDKALSFNTPPHFAAVYGLPIYVFAPMLLVYLITLTVTPLYHVRYLFTYASPFMIIVAQALWCLSTARRWLGRIAAVLMLLVSGWGLAEFWFNPLYRTDDHRAAVAQLAAQWRPGDLILVNAGWVYTALTTYWPTELIGSESALPPPIAQTPRMTNYAQQLRADDPAQHLQPTDVIVARAGSVDGPSTLGWGNPDSDFYAMSADQSVTTLTQIGDVHARIWQYRLYDTVSDPQGLLRNWFAGHTQLAIDVAFPGRDFLRLQRYASYIVKPTASSMIGQGFVPHIFAAGLQLQNSFVASSSSNSVAAGATLYVQTQWSMLAGGQKLPAANLSLRLYDSEEHLLAQQDITPEQATNTWSPSQNYDIPLALPVPVAAKPGDYALALIVYDQTNGVPLPTTGAQPASGAIKLTSIHVQVAQTPPEIAQTLASFGYIDLVTAQLARSHVQATEPLDIRLVWRPRASAYRDTYSAVLALQDAQGNVVQSESSALGGWDYPSGQWPANIPVQEWRQMRLTAKLPAGIYKLTLRVVRSSDNLPVPAHQGWWPWGGSELVLGNVTLE